MTNANIDSNDGTFPDANSNDNANNDANDDADNEYANTCTYDNT